MLRALPRGGVRRGPGRRVRCHCVALVCDALAEAAGDTAGGLAPQPLADAGPDPDVEVAEDMSEPWVVQLACAGFGCDAEAVVDQLSWGGALPDMDAADDGAADADDFCTEDGFDD